MIPTGMLQAQSFKIDVGVVFRGVNIGTPGEPNT